jgi:hypothetical protein
MAADCKSAGVSLRRFEPSPAHEDLDNLIENRAGKKNLVCLLLRGFEKSEVKYYDEQE